MMGPESFESRRRTTLIIIGDSKHTLYNYTQHALYYTHIGIASTALSTHFLVWLYDAAGMIVSIAPSTSLSPNLASLFET